MTSPAERPTASGFTLLEVLIVIAILALILGLFASRSGDHNKTLTLKGTGDALAEDLRLARADAILHGRETSLSVTRTPPGWTGPTGNPVALPADMAITVASTRAFGAVSTDDAVRFEPDGSSTGASILLTAGARKLEVDVDWLTGRVSVGSVP